MHLMVGDSGLLDVNGTLIAEVLAFIIMVIAFAKWVYPPIIRLAEQREKQIEAGVRAAQESEQRLASVQEQVAKQLDAAKEQAREIVNRAHREATVESEDVRSKARSDAEAILRQAQEEIRAERDRAVQDLRAEMASLVVDAAGRLIGETLDVRSHQRLIDESLTRVSGGNGAGRDA
jgi:F-type H+-transporting ATPase subunit b